nr:hypothetical protein [Tanacetum cinerariifolium]
MTASFGWSGGLLQKSTLDVCSRGDKKNIDSVGDSPRVIHCLSVVNYKPSLHKPKQGSELARRPSSSHGCSISFERLPYQRIFHHPLVEIKPLSFPIFCLGRSYLYYSAPLLPLMIYFAAFCLSGLERIASYRLKEPFDAIKKIDFAKFLKLARVFLKGSFYLFSLKDFPFVLVIDLLYFPLYVVKDALAQGANGLGLIKNEDHQVLRNEQKLKEDASDCTRVDDDGVEFSPGGGDYFPTMEHHMVCEDAFDCSLSLIELLKMETISLLEPFNR